LWIPTSLDGAKLDMPFGSLHLKDGQLLLHFHHLCPHPPRQRKPVPAAVRAFILDPKNNAQSLNQMCQKLYLGARTGKLEGVNIAEVTEANIRYWWIQTTKQRYWRDEDPWVSATMFLREQKDTVVHSYIEERRRFCCWYVPKIFDINTANVSEVYIDSTHATNCQNAELFVIIACEDGYGIPFGYMLMEKKPTEDSTLYPREVTRACERFFMHAKELGLYPKSIHVDKSATEIAAAKVCPL